MAHARAALAASKARCFASLGCYSAASTKPREALRICRASKPLRSCMTKAQTTWRCGRDVGEVASGQAGVRTATEESAHARG